MGACTACGFGCAKCCTVYAACGAIILAMFWFLISNDNITFRLQFSEKVHEEHLDYAAFRDEKARACLVGAAIYVVVWVVSIIVVKIGGRK
jgi:hypothetical protein|mmetsp:Transcript_81689/g.136579  ORF Transcript_81689/g.136579 Transcript_81689/m.136579 type:complete len:91 (+) Transcript_81689:53-325(+)